MDIISEIKKSGLAGRGGDAGDCHLWQQGFFSLLRLQSPHGCGEPEGIIPRIPKAAVAQTRVFRRVCGFFPWLHLRRCADKGKGRRVARAALLNRCHSRESGNPGLSLYAVPVCTLLSLPPRQPTAFPLEFLRFTTYQASGSVQFGTANPARFGRKQR